MAGPRKLIAGVIGALALTTLVLLAPGAHSRGAGEFDLKVAKHDDGPFRQGVKVGVSGNQTKTTTWRAKSTDNQDQQMLLFADADPNGYKVKWFKGNENISQDVEETIGYEFTLKAKKSKLFTAEIKRGQETGESACLDAGIMDAGLLSTSHAFVFVNNATC